jgi:hypothetical protein
MELIIIDTRILMLKQALFQVKTIPQYILEFFPQNNVTMLIWI